MASEQQQKEQSSSNNEQSQNPVMIIRSWCQQRPLTAGVGLWATGMAGTGLYLYNRNIRPSLKVIQARILAQAGILLGISLAGVISYLSGDNTAKPASNSMHLRQVTGPGTYGERKYGEWQPASPDTSADQTGTEATTDHVDVNARA